MLHIFFRHFSHVPTHFYKVLVAERLHDRRVVDSDGSNNGQERTEPVRTFAKAAFLFENKPHPESIQLTSKLVPFERIESAAGVRFFPRLAELERTEGVRVRELCDEVECKLPPPNWWMIDKEKKEKEALRRKSI